MSIELIPVVTADRIGALVRTLEGFSSRVAVADIYDEHNAVHRVFLKVFPPASHSLAGEVIRWSLGTTLSVPQPQRAWLCQIPAAMLQALWPETNWQQEWEGDLVPGFATLALDAAAPATPIGGFRDPVLREQLLAWPGLPTTIALDEWGANDDANLGNLLLLQQPDGSADFATVDGGRFLGGDYWTMESLATLRADAPFARRPSKLAIAAFGARPPAPALQSIITAAERHRAAYELCQPHLYFWATEILGDAGLAVAAMDLLKTRATLPWLKRLLQVAYA